jgi:hypothetical protein
MEYLYGNCKWCAEPESAHVRLKCQTQADPYGFALAIFRREGAQTSFIELVRCQKCHDRPVLGAQCGGLRVCDVCYAAHQQTPDGKRHAAYTAERDAEYVKFKERHMRGEE